MKKFNTTIVQKKCKCSPDCEKYPTIGYKGYFIYHFPGEIKKQLKSNKSITSRLSRQLHEVQGELKRAVKEKTKSDYLKVADILFGAFIKRRDADSLGNVNCVCCGGTFNTKEKTKDNDMVVQAMHFVSRATYSLRFNETNVHAGCCYCNLDMHLSPNGFAYQKYRSFLIDALGLDEVQRMEEQKREVGKITESDLKEIIDKYKTTKNDSRKHTD
jgi:hypothetical protein